MAYVILVVFLLASGTGIHASYKAEEKKAHEIQKIKRAAVKTKALKKRKITVAAKPLRVDGIELADLGRRDYA